MIPARVGGMISVANAGTSRGRPDARLRWEALDWGHEIPEAAAGLPEGNFLDLSGLGLSGAQRARLNRYFCCFTCELFIHFEGYLITYLERRSGEIPGLSAAMVQRFLHEERVHSEMFRRLLNRLAPSRYPDEGAPLRYLTWWAGDDAALRLAPTGSFFLLAWLFEEITLFVPQVIDEGEVPCDPLVASVMRLHAREELPHVALDERVLEHLTRGIPRWRAAAHSVLTLPLLVYVDHEFQRAWARLVGEAGDELGLDARQRRGLLARGPSQTDRLGMASFADKLRGNGLPGVGLLGWVLRRELQRHA
jgi:hypothetical protein